MMMSDRKQPVGTATELLLMTSTVPEGGGAQVSEGRTVYAKRRYFQEWRVVTSAWQQLR